MEASRWPLGWEWGLKKKALLKFDQSCDFFHWKFTGKLSVKDDNQMKIKIIVNLPTSSTMFRIDRSRFYKSCEQAFRQL